MFSKKRLSPLERRKRIIIARNDRLRGECDEIWSGIGRRVDLLEERLSWRRWIQPALSFASATAILYWRRKNDSDGRGSILGPLIASASQALERGRRQ